MRGKLSNPAKRMGVFKQLENVPSRYRLNTYSASYEGRDVWSEFMDERGEDFPSENTKYKVNRAGERWGDFMESRSNHYALPVPEDVEDYFDYLLTERDLKVSTTYRQYGDYLERFFSWLLYHTEHPHVYNPVLMSVVENPNGASGEVWDEKIGYTTTTGKGEGWRKDLQETLEEENNE